MTILNGDADRRFNRLVTRFKNKFRKRQKSEVAQIIAGVKRVCDELIGQGTAVEWASAGSMLVLQKLTDDPPGFAKLGP